MDRPLLLAFGLTILAGLSTGIGSAAVAFGRRTSRSFLSISLGFSAGVMIYVSFVELLVGARALLAAAHGQVLGSWIAAASFFGGMLVIGAIDYLVPTTGNPHEAATVEERNSGGADPNLARIGVLTALAIAIHNFPEGIATFFSTLSDPTVGVSVAIAVALHNIPEGIAIAVPVYYATHDKKKAFGWSFASGLAEPVGAVVGFVVLRPFLSDSVTAIVNAAVAGIMVFISLDQLVPHSKKYGQGHQSIYGLVGGMAVMAVTLLLL